MSNNAATLAKVSVSVIVALGFIACIIVLMIVDIDLKPAAEKAFLILVGILATSFGQVVCYWLGSSAGSAAKSEQLAALAAANNGTSR